MRGAVQPVIAFTECCSVSASGGGRASQATLVAVGSPFLQQGHLASWREVLGMARVEPITLCSTPLVSRAGLSLEWTSDGQPLSCTVRWLHLLCDRPCLQSGPCLRVLRCPEKRIVVDGSWWAGRELVVHPCS